MKKWIAAFAVVTILTGFILVFSINELNIFKPLKVPKFILPPIKKVKLPENYSTDDIVIPSGKDVFTQEDYKRAVVYPFLKSRLGHTKALREHPLYDAACLGIAKMLKAEKHRACADYAIKMLDKNPHDAIALLTLYHTRREYFNEEQWRKKALYCTKGMRYHILRYYMYEMAMNNGYNLHNIRAWLCLALFKLAIKEKLNKGDSQFVFREIIHYNNQSADWMIKNSLKIHPENIWLKNALLGKAYVDKAWDYRGGGWASEVTEAGWKGFDLFSKKAAKCYLKAWEIHKDLPEAAAGMIKIAMANSCEYNKILWFNRSVAAQVDFLRSYSRFLFSIRPRWCGSIEEMIYFGDKCFATKLFNTIVPQQMIECYLDATKDCPSRNWRAIYRREGIINNIEKCLNEYQKRNQRLADNGWEKRIAPDYFKVWIALFDFYAGNYEKTQKIINELGYEKFCKLEKEITDNKECVYYIKVSKWSKYFNGRFGNYYISAQDYYLRHEDENALKLMDKLLTQKDIPRDEKIFAAGLWARYKLGARADEYKFGRTPFTVACLNNRLDIAKKLLTYGVDINEKNDSGWTAMHCAVYDKKGIELLKFLVENGADVNALSNYDQYILDLFFTQKGAEEKIKYILKAGANPNLKSKRGFPLLMSAIEIGNLSYIKLLVDAGADVNAKNDKLNRTILAHAKKYGTPEIVKYLISKGAE